MRAVPNGLVLDALNATEFEPWTPVDARWTPGGRRKSRSASRLKTKAMPKQRDLRGCRQRGCCGGRLSIGVQDIPAP